jgi:hypothetical protein
LKSVSIDETVVQLMVAGGFEEERGPHPPALDQAVGCCREALLVKGRERLQSAIHDTGGGSAASDEGSSEGRREQWCVDADDEGEVRSDRVQPFANAAQRSETRLSVVDNDGVECGKLDFARTYDDDFIDDLSQGGHDVAD